MMTFSSSLVSTAPSLAPWFKFRHVGLNSKVIKPSRHDGHGFEGVAPRPRSIWTLFGFLDIWRGHNFGTPGPSKSTGVHAEDLRRHIHFLWVPSPHPPSALHPSSPPCSNSLTPGSILGYLTPQNTMVMLTSLYDVGRVRYDEILGLGKFVGAIALERRIASTYNPLSSLSHTASTTFIPLPIMSPEPNHML
ncbi:hypothetical protein D9758_016339 [Tetrapyrgos nigripes]|uniref:Uncharacterized protein n=1 Tax=Tetrapyrgos nigripes TaxID=182062 RepID=A0A8H5BXN5_9AGAR|nr:hypothetical protein D9758_016339 [Tetrapyrgos nigripes]